MGTAPAPLTVTIDRDQRDALLEEAGKLLDERWGLLGPDRTVTTTAEGDDVRGFKKDLAELPTYPEVTLIDDRKYLEEHTNLPFQSTTLLRDNRFYWIKFPVGLSPRQGWSFNRLEMLIEFTSAAEPYARPRIKTVFPDKKFETLFQAKVQLELEVNENLEISVKTGSLEQQIGSAAGKADATAGAKVAGGIGVTAGPFVHTLKIAKIDSNWTDEWVRWQLDGADFVSENRPDLILVAQVPNTATNLQISASFVAKRYFQFLAASVQKAVQNFPEGVKALFREGLPIYEKKSYDLTPVLTRKQ